MSDLETKKLQEIEDEEMLKQDRETLKNLKLLDKLKSECILKYRSSNGSELMFYAGINFTFDFLKEKGLFK